MPGFALSDPPPACNILGSSPQSVQRCKGAICWVVSGSNAKKTGMEQPCTWDEKKALSQPALTITRANITTS